LASIEGVLGKVTLDLECLRAIAAEAQLRALRQDAGTTHTDVERLTPRLVGQGT